MKKIFFAFIVSFLFVVLLAFRSDATDNVLGNVSAIRNNEIYEKEEALVNPEKSNDETIEGILKEDETILNDETIHVHDYISNVVNADCTREEITIYSCECGDTYQKITGEVLEHNYSISIIQPTCNEVGYYYYNCTLCGNSYKDNYVDSTGHLFTEWTIDVLPTQNNNGLEIRSCECGYIESREYICHHKQTIDKIVKNPSCQEYGVLETVCELCNSIINTKNIPIKEHSFGDWVINKKANPLENGEKTRYCECGELEKKELVFTPVDKNSIYIESANINVQYTVSSFTEEAIDTYDVVCNYDRKWAKSPIVLGHNTGSLKKLYNTEIGSYIYMYVDGELVVYKVVVSEKANEHKNKMGVDIRGLVTGYCMLLDEKEDIVSLYTCYQDKELGNIRWLVMAEKIK